MNALYHNDFWTLEDGLGISKTGDLLARMALEVDPPFSIKVTGKWGSGKTSVLRRSFVTLGGEPIHQSVPMGEDRIEPSEEWKSFQFSDEKRKKELCWIDTIYQAAQCSLPIWYSPWQHQTSDNPLIPLLLEIQAQFSAWIKFKEGAKNANRRGGLAAIALIERVIDAALSLKIGKPTKVWLKELPAMSARPGKRRLPILRNSATANVFTSFLKTRWKMRWQAYRKYLVNLKEISPRTRPV
jgi:hypothetical protein